jgi:hypothetical protein
MACPQSSAIAGSGEVEAMTEFALPPFVVPYGGWWIEVDMEGDLAPWARRSAM